MVSWGHLTSLGSPPPTTGPSAQAQPRPCGPWRPGHRGPAGRPSWDPPGPAGVRLDPDHVKSCSVYPPSQGEWSVCGHTAGDVLAVAHFQTLDWLVTTGAVRWPRAKAGPRQGQGGECPASCSGEDEPAASPCSRPSTAPRHRVRTCVHVHAHVCVCACTCVCMGCVHVCARACTHVCARMSSV